jgi:hypothetical protein
MEGIVYRAGHLVRWHERTGQVLGDDLFGNLIVSFSGGTVFAIIPKTHEALQSLVLLG